MVVIPSSHRPYEREGVVSTSCPGSVAALQTRASAQTTRSSFATPIFESAIP